MDFMLNIVLTFTDNMSGNMNTAVNSLQNLVNTANQMGNSLSNIEGTASLASLAVSANQVGQAFIGMGTQIGGVLTGLVKQVIATGSEFESFKITLRKLYEEPGDSLEDSVARAEKMVKKLLKFSVKSPFEVEDTKDLVTVLKSQGLEAFKKIQGVQSDTRQETLAWLGDLMAFKPDIPASRWRLAFTNFLGSGQAKVLENALDMGKIADVVGHAIGDTAEERMQTLVEFIETKGLNELMSSMFGTWQQTLSNMSDVFTQVFYGIAEGGAFDKFKEAIINISDALADINVKKLGKSLGYALEPIANIAVKASKGIARLIKNIEKFVKQHPKLARLGVVLATISSGILILGGAALIAVSKIANMVIVITELGKVLGGAGISIASITAALLPLAIALAGVYLAWRTDFMGIRSILTDLANNVSSAFDYSADAVSGNVDYMRQKLDELNHSDTSLFYQKATKGIMGVITVFRGLADVWSDGEMDYDLYLQAVELGVDDLIGYIYDFKVRVVELFKGIREGLEDDLKKAGRAIKRFYSYLKMNAEGTIFEGLFDTLEKTFGDGGIFSNLSDGLTGFFKLLSSGKLQSWKDFGESIGKFAPLILVVVLALRRLRRAMNFNPLGNFGGGLFGGDSRELNNRTRGVNRFARALGGIIRFGAGLALVGVGLFLIASAVEKIANTEGANTVLLEMVGSIAILMLLTSRLGENLNRSVAGMLAFGGMLILAGVGMELLADAALKLVGGGDDAIAVMFSMVGAIAALALVFSFIGEQLNKAIPGMLVFSGVMIILGLAMELFADAASTLSESDGLATFIVMMISIAALAGEFAALGSALLTAIPGMLVFAITLTILGAAMNLFADAVSTITGADGGLATFIVMMISIAAMAGIFAALGPALDVAVPGMLAFGAAILMVGEGINLASQGLERIVGIIANVAKAIGEKAKEIATNLDLASVVENVKSKFEDLKNGISDKLNAALNVIKGIVNKIKGVFNFSWSLPPLKIPHISVTGGKAPFGIGGKGSLPQFHIDWRAKGGVFDEPQLIGVGESGKEAVVPLEQNTEWISLMAKKFAEYLPLHLGNRSDEVEGQMIQPVNVNAPSVTTPAPIITSPTSGPVSNSTDNSRTDNSVHFEAGAIVIQAQGTSEADARTLAERIMNIIARQQSINRQTNYGISYGMG